MKDDRLARTFYLLDTLQAAPFGPYPLGRAVLITWIWAQLDKNPGDPGMMNVIAEFSEHLESLKATPMEKGHDGR
ncbi:hypothetical protein D3C84_603100 [compost metagenome]